MEGGAVRGLWAADGSDGEGGVGEESGERDGQRVHFGERGKRRHGVRGSEPVEARKSGDLSTDCSHEILSMRSAVGAFSTFKNQCGLPLA